MFTFIGSELILPLGHVNMYILILTLFGIATGRKSLSYCYCIIIVAKHICIFIDCTSIDIDTEHKS